MSARTCEKTGKVKYTRHQDAEKVVGFFQKQAGQGSVQAPQSVYRCCHCRRWHVTTLDAEVTRHINHVRRLRMRARKDCEVETG